MALYDDTGFISRQDAEQALESARQLIEVIRADVNSRNPDGHTRFSKALHKLLSKWEANILTKLYASHEKWQRATISPPTSVGIPGGNARSSYQRCGFLTEQEL